MINEFSISDFLADFAGSPYFVYIIIAISVIILFLVKSILKKGDEDDNSVREIENATYLQGVTYLLSKDTDKAIEEFTKAVKLNSETIAAYFALGTLFRQKGEYSKAIRIHQSIIARPNIDKDVKSQAYYNLGRDYKKAGMVQKGIDIFESISRNEKYKVAALYSLQSLYEDLKDSDNAIKSAREMARLENLDKSHIIAHLLTEKAKVVFNDGNAAEAKKIFKKAISLHSKCIDAHLHLGDLYFTQEEYLKAINRWKQVLEINSFFTHLAFPRLQEAYYNLGKYDAIEALLKDNLSKNEGNAYCHLALGRYYFNKGSIGEAVIELKEALRIDPDFFDAKKELGAIYIQSNMVDEMKSELKDILDSIPSKYNNYTCNQCGYMASDIMWKCPQCRKWDTIIPKEPRNA